MNSGPLLFFVGVTGHRDLRPDDVPALEAAVRHELRAARQAHPHSQLCLLSSLAEGADTLAARVALQEGAALWAILPMPVAQYSCDFAGKQARELEELLAQASKTITLQPLRTEEEHDPSARAEAYARAGAHMAACCDWMLALWDGTDNGKRGGTADVVRYRLRGAPYELMPPRDPLDAPETGPACHIFTPRLSGINTDKAAEDVGTETRAVGSVRVLWPHEDAHAEHGERRREVREEVRDEWQRAHARADEFNRDALELGSTLEEARRQSCDWVLPREQQEQLAAPEREMLHAYAMADALALHFSALTQRATRKIFAWMFVAACSFNLFDDLPLSSLLSKRVPESLAQAPWFLLFSLAVSAYCTIAVYGPARQGDFQNKHQDYRALAEGMRVQIFWSLSGIEEPAANHYLSKQRGELSWIQNALRFHHAQATAQDGTASTCNRRAGLEMTQTFWVEAQRDYFVRKARSEHESLERDENAIKVLLGISGSLAIALCAALLAPSLVPLPPLEQMRTFLNSDWVSASLIIAIALLALSAGLLHGYNQQRARAEHAKQFGRMSLLFDTAASRLQTLLQPDSGDQDAHSQEADVREARARDIIMALGREALNENADWVLLHRERPLEVPRAG